MSATPKPIKWRRSRVHGIVIGHVDGIELFTLGPGTLRNRRPSYVLTSQLPGTPSSQRVTGETGADAAAAGRAKAAELLAAFVATVTA